MSTPIKVLVAGGSGKLGQLIIQELLGKSERFSVRALVRPGSAAKITTPTAGLEIVESDLTDLDGLTRATEGVHTVISALSGGPDAILTGQVNLLEAGKRSGIKRFSPSDYSGEVRTLVEGDNVNLEMHQRVNALLDQNRGTVKLVHFLVGGFLEVMDHPFLNVMQLDAGKVVYYGTGNERNQVTTYSDTAKFVSEVISDPEAHGWFEFVGDETTWNQIADIYTEVTGKPLERISLGTVADLEARIAELKLGGMQNFMSFLPLQYTRLQLTGKGLLKNPANAKYPQIKPITVRDYFKRKY